jgi:aconitate hydratase
MGSLRSKGDGGLCVGGSTFRVYRLASQGLDRDELARLPVTTKILLENVVRHAGTADHLEALIGPRSGSRPACELSFRPARVLLQDFTGVPAMVDLALMREAVATLGGDPTKVNPLRPVDLVVDHSVQVDRFGTADAYHINLTNEIDRNRERYAFLRWGAHAFRGLRMIPPGRGICHQINLEHLAQVVRVENGVAFPDTLVGADSHTTMVNALGVLGWGVGGIEAEAALLGQPVPLLAPEVVGVSVCGRLQPGVTSTDLVLTITEKLRALNLVGKFVEFFGAGLDSLSLPDRATISNMSPEIGATCALFPVDARTLDYLRLTGRPPEHVKLVEAYCQEQGLFRDAQTPPPSFAQVVELDLGAVEPCIAGPRRPQDRIPLGEARRAFRSALVGMLEGPDFEQEHVETWLGEGGSHRLPPDDLLQPEEGPLVHAVAVKQGHLNYTLGHGAVVIAAITSCANTSNPSVMIAAGLLAKNAVERGCSTKPWVKTSFAPGSRVVSDYLARAGLSPYLAALGFHLVGYGCTTCIGNSGGLPAHLADAITKGNLVVASALSGNRNFEGRINEYVRMNYLMSPPLVVAYALAGNVDVDLTREPLCHDRNGSPVFLRDVWPDDAAIQRVMKDFITTQGFVDRYASVSDGDERWAALDVPATDTFAWDERSTYVRRPPFLDGLARTPAPLDDVVGARILVLLGDSVTTDHISPAGAIPHGSAAARYLDEQGVAPSAYHSYGARRGNHEVMMRGTFANLRLRNKLVDREGPYTRHLPSGEEMEIFDAAKRYESEHVPLVVVAGKEYGTGSSRDWAAKGPKLLGVRAVIAESFERIHRSNLVGVGVIPLQLVGGGSSKFDGSEIIDIPGLGRGLGIGQKLVVQAKRGDEVRSLDVVVRIDAPHELEIFTHGGVLPFVVRQLARVEAPAPRESRVSLSA